MSFEAYSVAVRLSLINGVSAGLMNISRAFAKVGGDAKEMQRRLDAIKFTMVAGAAMAGTGWFGLHLIGKTLPYAKEYSRQLALMNTLGMKHAEIAKVISQAWSTSSAVPTTTAAQNLATFRELRSAFGSDTSSQEHAAAMLPIVGRLAGVMQSLTGREQEHVGFDMVKAIELRTGVMTTEALKRNAELMSRTIIGMGGTVSVSDFHGALKMGKMATNKWSDDFTYDYLPTLMQELKTASGGGAQSAGTVLMSLYQQMHGRMTKAAMPLWVQSGLVNAADVVKTSTGQYQMKPGSVAGTGVFEANPFQWVQQYLRPAVAKLMAERHVSAETAINAMFSNRNAAFGAYNMYTKAAQYERDKATITKADGGYTAYQKLLKTDPTLAGQALHSQWQNMLAIIGYQIMPTLVAATLTLTHGLQGLAAEMRKHPTLTKALVVGFAALSGVMVFGGTVLMLAASFGALELALDVLAVPALLPAIVAGITALGAGIAAVGAPILLCVGALAALGVALYEIVKHWDASKSIIANIKAEAAMLWSWILDKVRSIFNVLAGGPPGPGVTHHNAAPSAHPGRPGYAGPVTHHNAAPSAHAGRPSLTGTSGSPYVAPSSVQKASYNGDVYIDGQKAGEVIWRHQADAMDRASRVGSDTFDPGMALTPVGMSYAT